MSESYLTWSVATSVALVTISLYSQVWPYASSARNSSYHTWNRNPARQIHSTAAPPSTGLCHRGTGGSLEESVTSDEYAPPSVMCWCILRSTVTRTKWFPRASGSSLNWSPPTAPPAFTAPITWTQSPEPLKTIWYSLRCSEGSDPRCPRLRPDQKRLARSRGRALPLHARRSVCACLETNGMNRETVSRGFAAAYGIPPQVFRAELRTRAAWPRSTRAVRSLSPSLPNRFRRPSPYDPMGYSRPGPFPSAAWRRESPFAEANSRIRPWQDSRPTLDHVACTALLPTTQSFSIAPNAVLFARQLDRRHETGAECRASDRVCVYSGPYPGGTMQRREVLRMLVVGAAHSHFAAQLCWRIFTKPKHKVGGDYKLRTLSPAAKCSGRHHDRLDHSSDRHAGREGRQVNEFIDVDSHRLGHDDERQAFLRRPCRRRISRATIFSARISSTPRPSSKTLCSVPSTTPRWPNIPRTRACATATPSPPIATISSKEISGTSSRASPSTATTLRKLVSRRRKTYRLFRALTMVACRCPEKKA